MVLRGGGTPQTVRCSECGIKMKEDVQMLVKMDGVCT